MDDDDEDQDKGGYDQKESFQMHERDNRLLTTKAEFTNYDGGNRKPR